MTLTIGTFLFVCPLLFLAGLVDAIGGGGGLISLPAYLIAGVPIHQAVATNKLSSTCGTTLATARFIKNGLVNFKLAIPSVISAVIGSAIGAKLSLMMGEKLMEYILFAILPIAAFIVLNKKLFKDNPDAELVLNQRTYITAVTAAFIIGMYDGFYGPGTGTFLIIAFTVFAKISVATANAQAKVINLTTNITSLIIFILNGQVLFTLGIAAAACNMLGGYIGAGLVIKKGSRIVKPTILLVLVLLLLKILGIF
ncbi:MAG: sulfite exporter TauE/SafE family protein [Lachnospiraceae bacterium]|nr:sulfite exporter TauE/SafE family protein [Lachnospiraceae bacterium]